MAVTGFSDANYYHGSTGLQITGGGFSVACWFIPNNLDTQAQVLFAFDVAAAGSGTFWRGSISGTTDDLLNHRRLEGTGSQFATAGGSVTEGTAHAGFWTFDTNTSSVRLDTGARATNNNSLNPGTIVELGIGRHSSIWASTLSFNDNGTIQRLVVWDFELSADWELAMAHGYPPDKVFPNNIVHDYKFESGALTTDTQGNMTLTQAGSPTHTTDLSFNTQNDQATYTRAIDVSGKTVAANPAGTDDLVFPLAGALTDISFEDSDSDSTADAILLDGTSNEVRAWLRCLPMVFHDNAFSPRLVCEIDAEFDLTTTRRTSLLLVHESHSADGTDGHGVALNVRHNGSTYEITAWQMSGYSFSSQEAAEDLGASAPGWTKAKIRIEIIDGIQKFTVYKWDSAWVAITGLNQVTITNTANSYIPILQASNTRTAQVRNITAVFDGPGSVLVPIGASFVPGRANTGGDDSAGSQVVSTTNASVWQRTGTWDVMTDPAWCGNGAHSTWSLPANDANTAKGSYWSYAVRDIIGAVSSGDNSGIFDRVVVSGMSNKGSTPLSHATGDDFQPPAAADPYEYAGAGTFTDYGGVRDWTTTLLAGDGRDIRVLFLIQGGNKDMVDDNPTEADLEARFQAIIDRHNLLYPTNVHFIFDVRRDSDSAVGDLTYLGQNATQNTRFADAVDDLIADNTNLVGIQGFNFVTDGPGVAQDPGPGAGWTQGTGLSPDGTHPGYGQNVSISALLSAALIAQFAAAGSGGGVGLHLGIGLA